MKDNFFKYIFIIILIVIGVLAYKGYKDTKTLEEDKKQENVVEQKAEVIKDLRLGISNFDTINPLLTKNREIVNIDKLVYEPLISIDKDYKMKMCLATEISKTGDRVYLIKLRQNVKWSDGTLFTAEDVRFTLVKLKEISTIYNQAVDNISSINIVDDYTIKIRVEANTMFFPYSLTFPIMPSHIYQEFDFATSGVIPCGTGMYNIIHVESSQIVLEKNPNYYDIEKRNAIIETIKVNVYAEMGEVYNSFKIGNIDLFNTSINNYTEYIGTMGFKVVEYPGREFDYLAFNCEKKSLRYNEVRRAISLAIDKDNIVSSVFNNAAYKSNFILDYGSFLYNDDGVSSGYNPEQAKKVLEDSGWEYKYNRWQRNGETISLNISVDVGNQARVNAANIIADQLRNIGMIINVIQVSTDNYYSILENKNYDILITGKYTSFTPNLDSYFGEYNLANYVSESMNNVLNEIKFISNETTLTEKFKEVLSIYQEDAPYVSLYRNKNNVIVSDKLFGEFECNNYNYFYNIETWYRVQ